ncbi:GNAT family N-acetyltransferase [Paenibacillus koleovorans]|uniref:GNAT family N-acetyltransferase n=1 Tax=Paenibacillus koleovorans TaxID=121608 RepID=UPI000FD6BAB6|nr:GNAT family N-acetyltransferase [Paenibacillus koleovorans]
MSSYTFQPGSREFFELIQTFPQDRQELYYMSPSAVYPLTADQLETIASARLHPTVILNEAGEPVGYANLYGYEPEKHVWLGNLIVHPDYRGKGAASALLREMLRIAREELQVPSLQLIVHNLNLTGILFYHKLGFKPYEFDPKVNYNGDALVGIKLVRGTERQDESDKAR